MLYIRKDKPNNEIIEKIAEVKNMQEWKSAKDGDTQVLRFCFDQLPKDDLRQSLLDEQHYLCAYCMKRIENDSMHTKIEHWNSISEKKTSMDYNNFLAVCTGGEKVNISHDEDRILCCDSLKGERKLSINPLSQEHMDKVKYTKDGRIYTDNPIFNEDINNVLGLNGKLDKKGQLVCDTATGLVKGRRDAYRKSEAVIKVLKKRNKYSSANIQNRIRKFMNADKRDEFVGTTVYFLKKEEKRLLAQGK